MISKSYNNNLSRNFKSKNCVTERNSMNSKCAYYLSLQFTSKIHCAKVGYRNEEIALIASECIIQYD